MKETADCTGVLIVEDDRDIRDSLKLVLEMEGFQARTAENGQAALEVLKNADRPCLILLDLMMPVMNGWEFLHSMQQDCVIATIPVVVVSAVAEKAKDHGVAGYVKKPVDLNVLLSLVRRFCPPRGKAA